MKKKAPLRTFLMWSNLFYVAPLVVALYYGLYVTAYLSLCVVFFGIIFHLYKEKKFLLPDRVSALLLIGTNLVLCYLGHFAFPYFYIALLFVFLAVFYDFYPTTKKDFDLNHGLWHLYGALITVFCILTISL